MSLPRYCIDTSSLLEAWARNYPLDVFPGFWQDLGGLIDHGVLVSPEEVKLELSKKDDEISEWLEEQPEFFVPFDADQEVHLIYIMENHEFLVKNTKRRNTADPFVIALAKTSGMIVVTEEQPGSDSKPKIPDVCASLGLRCVTILDLMRIEGWIYPRTT